MERQVSEEIGTGDRILYVDDDGLECTGTIVSELEVKGGILGAPSGVLLVVEPEIKENRRGVIELGRVRATMQGRRRRPSIISMA